MRIVDFLMLISIVVMPMDPSTMLPVRFLGVGISVSRLVVIGSAIFFAFDTLLRRKLPKLESLSICLVWILWYSISSLWGLNLVESSVVIKQLFFLVFVFLIVLFSYIQEKKGNLKTAFVFILVLSVLSGLVEQITGYRPPASRQHYFASQLVGFYFNPDFLGCTIGLLMPYLLDLKTGFLGSLWKILFFIASFFVLFRVSSYGALATLVISCVMYFLLKERLYGLAKLITLAALSVAVILVFANIGLVPTANIEKYSALSNFTDTSSYQSRIVLWSQTLQALDGHILFGYGAGTSEYVLGYSAHNLLLEIWAECGLVGLSLFLIVIAFLLVSLISSLGNDESKIFLSCLIASIPIWLTLSSVLQLWSFWAVIGGAFACRPLQRNAKKK
ncbi:MAG TPA: O-antigen ligase family protein [Clostridiales bacterium]|nr:O-antigen ligase family protein [Clostridiales bacterium]